MSADARRSARRDAAATRVNRALRRFTGYELHRPSNEQAQADAAFADVVHELDAEALRQMREANSARLLERPAFILSSVRSGSTLLRVVINTHSRLYAPHEMHLRSLRVNLKDSYVTKAMAELGSDQRDLQFLLWDRLLHRELTKRGKDVLVNKTPSDALMWERVVECWPDAQFIFLLRNPAAVVDSWQRARKHLTREQAEQDVYRYMAAVEDARTRHGGLTLRYEDFTADPETESRRICEFLEVPFEPGMLDYGRGQHGELRAGLGDWSSKIRSGTIQPARAVEDAGLGAELDALARTWEYSTG